jgi:hypothetical protein
VVVARIETPVVYGTSRSWVGGAHHLVSTLILWRLVIIGSCYGIVHTV